MTCMFSGHSKIYTGIRCRMPNLQMKCVLISHGFLCMKNTYGNDVSRHQHTKAYECTYQDKYDSNKWYHIKATQ